MSGPEIAGLGQSEGAVALKSRIFLVNAAALFIPKNMLQELYWKEFFIASLKFALIHSPKSVISYIEKRNYICYNASRQKDNTQYGKQTKPPVLQHWGFLFPF